MEEKLKTKIIEILTYFKDGLADIEAGSGEHQPMQDEIEEVLMVLDENYKVACPECLSLAPKSELEMFGGLCEECGGMPEEEED